MRRLRTTWSRRWAVAILVMSLLPLVAGPAAAAQPDATQGYAAWLRAQAHPDVVEQAETTVADALDAARSEAPHSLHAFTEAFAVAYTAASPSVSLAELFALPAVADAALYRVLHQRAQHLGRAAAVAPPSWRTSPPPTSHARTAPPGAALTVTVHGSTAIDGAQQPVHQEAIHPAHRIRVLSSADPRGP